MPTERICRVCGKTYIHNARVRCRDCREKRVKIAPSWTDGVNVVNAGVNARDRLFMRLCLYQAFREGELFGSDDPRHGNLKPMVRKQIDFVNKKIVVYGKGGTVEYVFLDNASVKLLKDYFKKRRIGMDRPVFYLTCRQAQRIVKEAARVAKVEAWDRFSPHILRSISITRMVTMKGLSRAKHHARHSSERTTIIYDRPPLDVRRDDFDDVFES